MTRTVILIRARDRRLFQAFLLRAKCVCTHVCRSGGGHVGTHCPGT